jgi:hypothetical protein
VLGADVHEHIDVGLRFGFVSDTTKSGDDASSPELKTARWQLAPYGAFVVGSRASVVRPFIGLTAGLGSGKTTTSGGTPATSTESKVSSWQLGALVGLRIRPDDILSIDPTIQINRTVSTMGNGGSDLSLKGIGVVVAIGISGWFGSAATSSVASEPTAAAPSAMPPNESTIGAAPATNSPATTEPPPTPSSSSPTSSSTKGTSDETAVSSARADSSERLNLDLREGRRLMLVPVGDRASRRLKLTLMKVPYSDEVGQCGHVVVHALRQEEGTIEVAHKRQAIASGEVALLNAEISASALEPLTLAPVSANAVMTIDHWFGVCGQRWPITPIERRKLKQYLDAL